MAAQQGEDTEQDDCPGQGVFGGFVAGFEHETFKTPARREGIEGVGGPAQERKGLLLVTCSLGLDFVGVEGGVFDVARVSDLAHVDDFGATGFGPQLSQLRLSDQGTGNAFANRLQFEAEPLSDETLVAAVDEVHGTDFDLARGQIQL